MDMLKSFQDTVPWSISTMLGRKQVQEVPLTSIQYVAKYLNQPEAAIRLLLTLLAGYLLALAYRIFMKLRLPTVLRHVFLASCGISLCYFNYGMKIYHSMLTVLISHSLMHIFRESHYLVPVTFTFNMTYLLVGYYTTESDGYDILWTMPQCVLALRMIGMSFDLRDGAKGGEELSNSQNALLNVPAVWEILGFAYFPSSFLVGPQYAYKRYGSFVRGEFPYNAAAVVTGLTRLIVGLCYLGLRQLGTYYIPDDYLLGSEFQNKCLMVRLVYLGLWGKSSLYKYVACWLITEGALMCFGISYNGMVDDQIADWYGCSNVKLWLLETGTTMQHYIQSFNVNTNLWVSQYIYKRLKFINNRLISFSATLLFLALWHGFHSGYYMCFLLEYAVITVEKQIEQVYKKALLPKFAFLNHNICQLLILCTMKFYNVVCMGWCLLPFVFLRYDRWMLASKNVEHIGLIFILLWLMIYVVYKMIASPNNAADNAEAERQPRATEFTPKNDTEDATYSANKQPTTDPTAFGSGTENLRQRSKQT